MDVGTPLARLILWLVPIDDCASHSGRPEQFLEKRRKLSCDFIIVAISCERDPKICVRIGSSNIRRHHG